MNTIANLFSKSFFVLSLLIFNNLFCMEDTPEQFSMIAPSLNEVNYNLGSVEGQDCTLIPKILKNLKKARILNVKNRVWFRCMSIYPAIPFDPDLFKPTKEELDLREANFYKIFFGGCNLVRVNFQGAFLNESCFAGTFLMQSNLSYASLRGADLKKARLQYADMHNVDLCNAGLRGADFEGVSGLTAEQKEYARLAGAINVPE